MRQIAGILFLGVIFMNAENFINYLGIGCTVLGSSLFSLVSIFGKQIKFPCSSNLYKELEQHSLQILWIGKDVDKYIRWIRIHILLYIALSMSAIAVTLALVVLEESNVVFSFFFPIILISGIFVSFSEKGQGEESFSAQEKTVLIGSYVVGSSVFAIVFSTIESVESVSMQVIYFVLMLVIVFVLYQVPLTYYNERIKADGKLLFVGKFIGRATHSLVITLHNKEILDFNQEFFYPIFGDSSIVTILYPNKIGNCYIGKEQIASIFYDGEDVTKELL